MKTNFAPFYRGVFSKRKEFAPHGSKFFPSRVDPFLEGNWGTGKQTESHKSCLPCEKIVENLPGVFSSFQ